MTNRFAGRAWPSLIAFLLLGACYLALRLPSLMALPLFNDEAVYLLRAQRFPQMLAAEGPAGATLPDGKLIQELLLAALAALPGDPLVPSRLLSLACGLATTLTLAALGRALGRPVAGLLAGALYALSPLALIHDLLGLPDSLLTLVSVLLLWASVQLGSRPQATRRDAAVVGVLLAVAALVKLAGLLLFAVPLLAVLLLPNSWAERRRRLGLLRTTLIIALACVAALAPLHYGGAERQKLAGEAQGRLTVIVRNLGDVTAWTARYLPGPLLLLPLLLLGLEARRRRTEDRRPTTDDRPSAIGYRLSAIGYRPVAFLLAAGLATMGAFAVVGLTLYPRYLLPAWPPLLLAAAVAGEELWRRAGGARVVAAALGAGAVAWGLFFAVSFASNPLRAPLAASDRAQYLERWTAGYNLPVLLADLRAESAARGGITLVNHSQTRLVNLAPQIYLADAPEIAQRSLDLAAPDAPAALQALARSGPTYVLVDAQVAEGYGLDTRFPGLQLAHAYAHPSGTMRFLLFEQR